MKAPFAERVLRRAVRLLPPRRRELGEALLAEAAVVPAGARRVRWLMGGVWFVAREAARENIAYLLGVAAAAGTVGVLDEFARSDDSSQVVMAALLAGTAALGCLRPRRAWWTAAIVGSSVALVSLADVATHTRVDLPPPGGAAGAATLFFLLLPAASGAWAGAGLRHMTSRAR